MRGTAVWRVMRVRALDFVLPSRSAKSLGRKKKWRHFVTKKEKWSCTHMRRRKYIHGEGLGLG